MDWSDIELAYKSAEPASQMSVSPGWYRARACSASPRQAKTGSYGLRVEFVIIDGPCRGVLLAKVYWLTERALPYSKRDLELAGFEGESPTQVAERTDFEDLPEVRVLVETRFYGDRSFTEVTQVQAAPDGRA